MNEAEIRKYARLMQELGLTGLEVKENLGVVRLERAGAASPAVMTAAAPAVQDVPAAPASSEVRSPMVGIFYAAPAEDALVYEVSTTGEATGNKPEDID